jgi:basic membrane lipoprotein Med (substrate-binding protein (PBP1-ABC) superfamily)
MAKVVLLSCTKSKTKHAAPAQELYSASPMFQKTLEYGKSLKPDKMYILSAKHHLVPLTKTLEPYDKTLKEMPKDEKEKWGEETVKQMKSSGINPEKDQFIFLTGSEYMKPLAKYIPDGNIEKPMEGKRFGERLKWLNSQVQKLTEAFKRLKNLIYESLKK